MMAINIQTEKIISFEEARSHLPARRNNRQAAISTFYRWSTNGLHGVHLETIQIGGTRCTSVEALQRFFENLAQIEGRETSISHSETDRLSELNAQLDTAGF